MKKPLIIFFIILFSAGIAFAQGTGTGTALPTAMTVTLTWDPMPTGAGWIEVRIYEIIDAVYVRAATVAGDQTEAVIVGVVPGLHTYVARSFSIMESIDSNSVTTPDLPAAPMNLNITVTITGG